MGVDRLQARRVWARWRRPRKGAGRALGVKALGCALHAVQATVDARGDGLDLRGQLLFHTVQVVAIVEGDQVDGKTQVPESARATNAVQVPADRHKVGRLV